jgi:signal transduction histidine kinase/CHASE3 domain sensor protein/ActR/RegA family two-component response regulator
MSERSLLSRFWADLPLWLKGLSVLALPLGMMLLGLAMLFWAQRGEKEAAAWVQHTVEVKYALSSLQAALAESISLVWGDALARNGDRLAAYRAGWARAQEARAELTKLVRDNPGQLERVGQIAARMDELREVLEAALAARQGRPPVATPDELLRRQRLILDDLRRLIGATQQEEDRLLGARQSAQARTQTAVVVVLALSLGLGVLSGVLASVLLSRGILSRVGLLAANAARLVRGEPLLPLPPAGDELGRLAQAQQQAYALLQAERERLRLAMAGGGLALFEVDLEAGRVQLQGEVQTPPQSFEELLSLVLPEDRERFREAFEQAWAGGAPLDLECRVQGPGGVNWWVVRGQRHQDRLVGVAHDVTGRRLAEHERERLHTLLEAVVASVDEGLLVTDERGVVQFYNPQLLETLQISAELLQIPDLEQRMQIFAQQVEDPETYLKTVTERFGDREAEAVDLIRLRGGRVLERVARVQRLEGESPGRLWVYRDITQRVNAEAALRSAQAQAEQARLSAEAASRAKSEFLSRMSHELRTPMNAILGFAQLLEMEDPTPAQRESIEQILKAGRHLLQLINEVLDISRIEAGRLPLSLEPLYLDEVVQECLSLIGSVAATRRIQLEFPAPEACHLLIQADHQRLKQVLLNLLSNAIKYNRDGGRVSLFCWETPQGTLLLGVQDTGPGIAPELLERLFTPFDRLGAEHGREEGTGLGLTLSRALAEAMQGRLWAESQPGQGSTFWLELPLADPEALAGQEPERSTPHAPYSPRGPRKLLYVEDNLSNLRLVERLLARWPNVQLLSAMQGRLGLELALAQLPDLILLDLHLPDLPGTEVLARLKSNPNTRAIPVIILSAEASEHQIERLLAQGAAAYLTKPLDLNEFYRVLRQVLGEAAAETGPPGPEA